MEELEEPKISAQTPAEAAPALPTLTEEQKEMSGTPEERLKYLREVYTIFFRIKGDFIVAVVAEGGNV